MAVSNSVSPEVECVVIGAGVIGLACAYQLARAGREVYVLERESAIGQGISSRNGEVIHAGIYYPPGTLKARFCVEGRKALYAFCAEHGVAFNRCEKIIVACSDQQKGRLESIASRACANGVDDLRALSRDDLRAIEPELRGVSGLLSPSTGIVSAHEYVLALQGAIEARSGAVVLRSPVVAGEAFGDATRLTIGGPNGATITAKYVILAGGLSATKLARSFSSITPSTIPQIYFARGNYFGLTRRAPFSRLIYPVPEPAAGGLGVHLTFDLGGQARFGPDVEWLEPGEPDALSYAVDASRAEQFYAAIRAYWPDLRDGELQPAYAGIRPKLSRRGEADADFVIHAHRNHGARGIVALYGIESPGLTSSLAIGAHVASLF